MIPEEIELLIKERRRFKKVWRAMHSRCFNPDDINYYSYGFKGIIVELEWFDYDQFVKDMWPRPSPYHSIDRIDNKGNYCKANCRWATALEQSEKWKKEHSSA